MGFCAAVVAGESVKLPSVRRSPTREKGPYYADGTATLIR
jgi:hypothetical protein